MTCLQEVTRKSRGIASLARLQLVSLAMVMFYDVTFLCWIKPCSIPVKGYKVWKIFQSDCVVVFLSELHSRTCYALITH